MSQAGAVEVLGENRAVGKPRCEPIGYSPPRAALLVAADVAMFALSAWLAMRLVGSWNPDVPSWDTYRSATISIVLFLAVFHAIGLYTSSYAFSPKDELYFTIAGLCIASAPQLVLFTIFPMIATSRLVLLCSLLIAIATVGSTRALLRGLYDALDARHPLRIAVAGDDRRVDGVIEALKAGRRSEILRLGYEDFEATIGGINLTRDATLSGIPWLQEARAWGCQMLLLTETLPPFVLPHILQLMRKEAIRVAFAPPRIKQHAFRLSLQPVGRQAIILASPLKACQPPARLTKRLFDLIAASILLVLAAPIMVAAAIAVKVSSRGPILFKQRRITKDGSVFEILKFRSMPVGSEDATGPVWSVAGDRRATRVGTFLRRTSIDELPQLFNILRGDMSLVGPRPERPYFAEAFRQILPRYDERHLVRAGLTGLSHMQMRRSVDPSNIDMRLEYDLYYVEHWSLFLDISILFKTAFELLFQRAV